jgi:hypothetical protein
MRFALFKNGGMAEWLKASRQNGIPVNPGRGFVDSAAGGGGGESESWTVWFTGRSERAHPTASSKTKKVCATA